MFKPVSPRSAIMVASLYDPAVDWETLIARQREKEPEATDELCRLRFRYEFTETIQKNPAKSKEILPVKSGERLTHFKVGVIPTEDLVRIMDDARFGHAEVRTTELWWGCFLAAVQDIDGWPEPPTTGKDGKVERKWLRETFVADLRHAALEVGRMAFAFNSISEEETKN